MRSQYCIKNWRVNLISHRVYVSSMGILRPSDIIHAGNNYEGYFISMLVFAEACEVCKDVILVFEEANHFCKLLEEFKSSFIDTLRHLNQLTRNQLLSMMLVVTDFLLEHLAIANSYRKILEFESSSTSDMSPFSHDGHFTRSNFTVGKVGILLAQFKTFDLFWDDGFIVDVDNIVGARKLLRLKGVVQDLKLDIRNCDAEGEGLLNNLVGADYVQKEKKFPVALVIQMCCRCATLDGDIDIILFFYAKEVEGGEAMSPQLLDGDKILVLFAMFI
ncbi:hypothetical protein L7F22_010846 [Adiantum nelumboides]|nr:hypothetical protein [Adiantum nelumboides]